MEEIGFHNYEAESRIVIFCHMDLLETIEIKRRLCYNFDIYRFDGIGQKITY